MLKLYSANGGVIGLAEGRTCGILIYDSAIIFAFTWKLQVVPDGSQHATSAVKDATAVVTGCIQEQLYR